MSDTFSLDFTTNIVKYTVGKQGAARKVPLIMAVDASNEKLVQEIGRLSIDQQSFCKAVRAAKHCGERAHVQVFGNNELFNIKLSLAGNGPVKLKRKQFETQGSVNRIKVTVAAEAAASAEIIIRTTGNTEELAQWMIRMAGYDLQAEFEQAQEEMFDDKGNVK